MVLLIFPTRLPPRHVELAGPLRAAPALGATLPSGSPVLEGAVAVLRSGGPVHPWGEGIRARPPQRIRSHTTVVTVGEVLRPSARGCTLTYQ
jgi:hypothetical protein